MDIKPISNKEDLLGEDFDKKEEAPKPTPVHTAPETKITFDDPSTASSKTGFPYFASLVAFVLLLLSALYSVMSLINYVMEKWLVKPQHSTSGAYSYIDFSSFDTYLAVGAISAIIITIPVLVIFIGIVRRAEDKETWRSSLKWRRIIYSAVAVILILSLVSTLIGVVYEVLSNNLKLSELSYDAYSTSSKPDLGGQMVSAVSSGIANSVLIIIALVTIFFEYANKYRKVIWGTIAILIIIGTTMSVISIGYVNKTIKDAKKQNSSYNDPYKDYNYSDTTTDQNNYSY